MNAEDKFTSESIIWIKFWAPHLFSFRTTRSPNFQFTAGQFARLGLVRPEAGPDTPATERAVWRAYSIVSAVTDDYLEFYSVLVPEGEFTNLLARLVPGDTLLIEKTSYGFLTTERFAPGADLWMLSTGTGLGPFLSILRDVASLSRFRQMIVVNSVRASNELAYREEILEMAASPLSQNSGTQIQYVPVVTRDAGAGTLHARIPQLIASGALESAAGTVLDLARSRVMLCGNPAMVAETRALLAERGYMGSRRNQPGSLAVENYW